MGQGMQGGYKAFGICKVAHHSQAERHLCFCRLGRLVFNLQVFQAQSRCQRVQVALTESDGREQVVIE